MCSFMPIDMHTSSRLRGHYDVTNIPLGYWSLVLLAHKLSKGPRSRPNCPRWAPPNIYIYVLQGQGDNGGQLLALFVEIEGENVKLETSSKCTLHGSHIKVIFISSFLYRPTWLKPRFHKTPLTDIIQREKGIPKSSRGRKSKDNWIAMRLKLRATLQIMFDGR